jgi:hypothetical protein
MLLLPEHTGAHLKVRHKAERQKVRTIVFYLFHNAVNRLFTQHDIRIFL